MNLKKLKCIYYKLYLIILLNRNFTNGANIHLNNTNESKIRLCSHKSESVNIYLLGLNFKEKFIWLHCFSYLHLSLWTLATFSVAIDGIDPFNKHSGGKLLFDKHSRVREKLT